jgi:hypothetical protein
MRAQRDVWWRQQLRRASNKGTLRAFRNADRFTTFKIFRLFWEFALARAESGEL